MRNTTEEGLAVQRGYAANGPRQPRTEGGRLRGVSECPAGCCPHDSARLDEDCPRDLPGAPAQERIVHLRSCQLMPIARIAALTGIDRQRVTRLLYGAATGPEGTGRHPARRAGEDHWPDAATAPLSREAGAGAGRAGPRSARGPSEAELLTALYADPEVRRVLDKHGIPVVTLTGPVWKRFPAPQPLSTDLVSELYQGCGLALHHIELLTGRTAAAVGAVLRAKGVQLRPAGDTSPFTRRWRGTDRPGEARSRPRSAGSPSLPGRTESLRRRPVRDCRPFPPRAKGIPWPRRRRLACARAAAVPRPGEAVVAAAKPLQSGRLDAYLLCMLIALAAVIVVVTALA